MYMLKKNRQEMFISIMLEAVG